jgi:hypothetical protein
LTGRFPARGSPAARVERCGSFTGSRRTSGCLESRLGWSEMGCRRQAAACGFGARRRGDSGGVRVRGRGLGVARGRGAANGGGCRGGAGLGWRLRGGVSSPAYQRGGGGVLRCGSEERAKERVKSTPGVLVVLRRAKDRELGLWFGLSTAASRWRPPGWFWKRQGCVARPRSSSARQQEGEEVVRDAWVPAHGEVMAGKAGKAPAGGAVGGRRREAEQGGGRRG